MRRLFDHEPPESVALVRLRVGLGDLLCTVPALRALRARLPDARIVLVTFAEVRPIVERLVPRVELLEFPGWPGIPERPPDRDAIPDFLAHARAQRFGLALQVYGANPAANEVTEALGARRTGGFFVPGTLPVPPDLETHVPYPLHEHEVRRHLHLSEHLGAPPAGGEALHFPLTPDDEDEAARVRAAAGLERYAIVHPGATSPSRLWPAERFARVADALAAQGLRIAVTGVPGEEELTGAVVAAMRAPAADLCGATSLGGYAALLRDAALLVANDTGSAHLAAALGTPSVTVFLSGDPVRWSYADDPRHPIARVQVECNPCHHLSCPIDHRCADRVTVDQVLAAAQASTSSVRRATWPSSSIT